MGHVFVAASTPRKSGSSAPLIHHSPGFDIANMKWAISSAAWPFPYSEIGRCGA
jgi:hypothetical protein